MRPAALSVTLGFAFLLAAGVGGCSWGRFNKLKDDTPVVRLQPPEYYNGSFGTQLAASWNDETATLYVGGAAWSGGGMTFSLGLLESPSDYPLDAQHCPFASDELNCRAAGQAVGLHVSHISEMGDGDELCFATGTAEEAGQYGVFVRCESGSQFLLDLPDDVEGSRLMTAQEGDDTGLFLSANAHGEQLLIATHAAQHKGWFYPYQSWLPRDIPVAPEAGEDWGAVAAVAKVDSGHLLFVAAPSSGQLWIYRFDGDEVSTVACLGREAKFARTLATGDVDGDGVSDVAIAGEREVMLVSGARLDELSERDDVACSDAALLGDAVLAEFGCESPADIGDCGGSDFGASLAIADLDGTGHGLVAVGAPKIAVDGRRQAGAAFVYDAEGEYRDILRISDPHEKDSFGSSLIGVSQGEREIFAVGARRARYAYLFYCSGAESPPDSRRCE